MIVVTGAAGFIGWNIYQRLRGSSSLLLVDFLGKFEDDFIPDESCRWTNIMDPFVFLERLKDPEFASSIELIYHQGACSDTMNYDVHYMMKHNFDYSHTLLKRCIQYGIDLIYASSAAVYGNDGTTPFYEAVTSAPKNIYAKSKMLFDQYVEDFIGKSATQIVGLRYFNVYGPWEYRKGRMASVMNQFHNQIKDNSHIKIFENSENYLRDFIYVEDVVNVNLHFAQNKQLSGIFNCGTGVPRAFADIPKALSAHYKFEVEEVKMPTALEGKYQTFTQANLNKLVHTGQYRNPFLSLEEGIGKYVDFWSK